MKNRKSNTFILSLLVSTGFFLQSCHKGSFWGIRGVGSDITETRQMNSFNALDLETDADVSYVQDSLSRLEITGQQNILAVLETKLEGNTLKIDFKRMVWKHDRLNIIIHSPALKNIRLSGSGNLFAETLNVNTLDVLISGSGNITISSLSLQTLIARLSGSSNITLNGGSCNTANFTVSGSGNIDSGFMNCVNGTALISGSGNVTMNVSQSLDVDISGSGELKYKGNPAINSKITGSGMLVHF